MNKSVLDVVVVGSGAAAVAAIRVLIDAGIVPLVVDGGIEPPRTIQSRGSLPTIREASTPTGVGAVKANPGEKLWFGSNYPFSQNKSSKVSYSPEVVARASHAVGGLTRVWGGTFSFFTKFEKWPADCIPAQLDLDLIRKLVPHSRTHFEAKHSAVENPGFVAGSPASGTYFKKFGRKFSPRKWITEASVVSIDSAAESSRRCLSIGSCLAGCPQNSIWFAGDQVLAWEAEGKLERRSLLVESITGSTFGYFVLKGTNQTGVVDVISAKKVFLAAGPIESAAILARSGHIKEAVIQDVATAFSAAISLRAAKKQTQKGTHNLSQWWVKSADSSFSAQFYPPDLSNAARIRSRFPSLRFFTFILELLAVRIHPVIVYLEGDQSDALHVSRHGDQLLVKTAASKETTIRLKQKLQTLAIDLAKIGLFMPVFATEYSRPGTGYHFGASLPHGRDTDSLGQIQGLKGLHIIDASVLPNLEVGSITPTVMANAARIARASIAEHE